MLRKLLAALAVAAFVAPLIVAQTDVTSAIAVTTDIDIAESDPDLAAMAGHAKYEVSWFGAGVLYSRDVPASEEICAVPDGQSTPVGQTRNATSTYHAFTDPNGSSWNTTKYTYGALETYCVPVQATASDATIGTYNFVLMANTTDLGTVELDLYVV